VGSPGWKTNWYCHHNGKAIWFLLKVFLTIWFFKRITHATPAAAYAHSPSRHWESFNGQEFTRKQKEEGCSDIASQLVDENSFINVVFGGGRKFFLPKSVPDYDNSTKNFGDRIDNRHLINDWRFNMQKNNKSHKFIWNAADLRNLECKYDHVMGMLEIID
jgi:alkaline phosphatase